MFENLTWPETTNAKKALNAALAAMATYGSDEQDMAMIGSMLVDAHKADAEAFKEYEHNRITVATPGLDMGDQL